MAMSMLRPPAAFASPCGLRSAPRTSAVASGSLPRPAAATRQLSASRGPRPHARRQPPPQAADSCYRTAAPTSRPPSEPRPRRLQAAGFQGSLPRSHARRLPPQSSVSLGHPPTAPTTRLSIVPRPRRVQAAEFRVSAVPRRPRPPRAVEQEQPTENKGPTAPRMRLWGRAAAVVSSQSSPTAHLSLVVFLCVIRSPGFEGMMKRLGERFGLPQKLTLSIILGASVISVLYDLVMGGKDLEDISAYLRGFEKPDDASSGDEQHD